MRNGIKRKIGFILVIAMLVVMIYPGESGSASEESNGFWIENGVVKDYVGAENAVIIPDGVTAIGDSAFQGKSITSVAIPGSVTSIGNYAFANCSALGSVTVSSSVASVGAAAFSGCTSLGSLEWQSGAGIPDNAFSDCLSLTTVALSAGLPSIGSEAFKNCESLASIAIPGGTGSIASNAFDGCANMASINVDGSNAFYTSYDGSLYSSSGVALYRCPQGSGGVSIHDGTQVIESNAFYGCKFGTVAVPSSVTTIKLDAFTGSEIQTLILSSAVATFEPQTSFSVNSIEVPGDAPVAGQLVDEYGEIVVTDYTPGGDTENPGGDTENPGGDTENPGGDTENPGGDTENPGGDTENPGGDTENPGGDTENPGGDTENPGGNTENPGGDTENPGGSTDNPGGTTENPGGNTGNSGGDQNQSGNSQNTGTNNRNPGSGTAGTSGGTAKVTTNTVKSGIPYVAGSKGTEGWDKICEKMKSAAEGSEIHINMNGSTKVPKNALALAKDKKLTLVLDMGNGITWTLKGKDITSDILSDIDFGVKLGTGKVPQALQADVAGQSYAVQMQLVYDGVFGLTAVLKVNLGQAAGGHNAILYYYNKEEEKLEYIAGELVKANGDVSFSFAHASDYVIVVDGLSPSAAGNVTTDAHIKDDTPKTGPELNAKYIMCLGVMLLGIYMILTSKKEKCRAAS